MTTGEGGMITTADDELARKCRLLRAQGMEVRYQNEMVGLNVRMTDMAAAFGRVQLTRLSAWTEARRANASAYDAQLSRVTVPAVANDAHHVYHQYTIRSADRDGLLARLREHEIGCDVYYPTPVHALPSFGLEIELPITEMVSQEVLSIPVHPFLTTEERTKIIEVINQ